MYREYQPFEKHRVLSCLQIVDVEYGRSFRCDHCWKMQYKPKHMVYVPDGIKGNETPEDIINYLKSLHGIFTTSGWCLPCAQKLSRPKLHQNIFHRCIQRFVDMF